MKFAVSFLALVCLAIANGQATTSESDEVKEHLIKLEKQSWEAWKNHDGEFFRNFLSDDHVEVGFGGLTNKAEVVAFVGSAVCTVKSYKLDRFEMKMLDKETAVALLGQFALHEARRQMAACILSANADSKIANGNDQAVASSANSDVGIS